MDAKLAKISNEMDANTRRVELTKFVGLQMKWVYSTGYYFVVRYLPLS